MSRRKWPKFDVIGVAQVVVIAVLVLYLVVRYAKLGLVLG